MPKPTDKDLARANGCSRCASSTSTRSSRPRSTAQLQRRRHALVGDFRQVLRDLGIMFPPNEFRDLCASYDVDGDKEISYPEVMARLATMLDPDGDNIFGFKGASGVVRKGRPTSTGAERLLASKLFDKFANMRQAFRDIDKDGNGYLTKGELEQELRRTGCSFSPEEFHKLWGTFDVNGDGRCHAEFNARIGTFLVQTARDARRRRAEGRRRARRRRRCRVAMKPSPALLAATLARREPLALALPIAGTRARAHDDRAGPHARGRQGMLPPMANSPQPMEGQQRPMTGSGFGTTRNLTAKRAGEMLIHSIGEKVQTNNHTLSKIFLLCDDRGDGRVSLSQFRRILMQQLPGCSYVDCKLCCRVFGERVGGNVVLVNYRKFLRHFDCSCHGITNMKAGPRALSPEHISKARARSPSAEERRPRGSVCAAASRARCARPSRSRTRDPADARVPGRRPEVAPRACGRWASSPLSSRRTEMSVPIEIWTPPLVWL